VLKHEHSKCMPRGVRLLQPKKHWSAGIVWHWRIFEGTPRDHYAPPPSQPDDLVLAVEICRERDVAAASARYQARDELRAAEAARERYDQKVTSCAIAVLAQHAAEVGLGQRVADLQRQAADEGAKLLWLVNRHQRQSGPVISRAREDLVWRDLGDVTGGQAMEAALQSLKRDATAEIG
jgi:hypothetical protein